MEMHPLGEMMETTMAKIKEMVDVNTIVGTPITTPDGITLIPVSRVSFGFGSGGSDFPVKDKSGFAGANGAGVKIEPIGFLTIKDGTVRMINITPPATHHPTASWRCSRTSSTGGGVHRHAQGGQAE